MQTIIAQPNVVILLVPLNVQVVLMMLLTTGSTQVCMCVCMRACVRACACVHACVRVCVCSRPCYVCV